MVVAEYYHIITIIIITTTTTIIIIIITITITIIIITSEILDLGRFAFGRSDLAPSSPWGCDVGPVYLFGFSWAVAVSLRKPPIMRVGFPWISLDSLVRI